MRAWASADAEGRRTLTRTLGNPNASPDDVEAARAVLRDTGSLEYSERRIRALAARAYRRIDASSSFRAPARALLKEVGDKLVHRAV